MSQRRLILNTALNTRELGGHMNKNGNITNYKTFLRSDSVASCDENDIKILLDYGVNTIIDFRSIVECEREPNIFSTNSKVKYFHIPLLIERDMTDIKVMQNIKFEEMYIGILENHNAMLYLFNTIIDNLEGVTLFHCSAGKDRTGVVASLLLMLASVDKYDIIADYEVSSTYLSKSLQKMLDLFPDMPMHLVQSKPEWIEHFYNHLINKYVGVFEYLIFIGIKESDILMLRNRLLD